MRAQQKVQTWDRVAGCPPIVLVRGKVTSAKVWVLAGIVCSGQLSDFCLKHFSRKRNLGTTSLFDVHDPDLCLTVHKESACKCCGAFVQWWQTKTGEWIKMQNGSISNCPENCGRVIHNQGKPKLPNYLSHISQICRTTRGQSKFNFARLWKCFYSYTTWKMFNPHHWQKVLLWLL